MSIFKDNEDSFLYFDKKTLDHIISALNEAQKKDIGNELKTSMMKLGNNAGMCKWEQDVLKESINNKDRGRFEKRVRFEIPQKHSTPSRPQGETSNLASQRPLLRRFVDLNKRQPASHPDQSTQAQNNPPEVPDRLRKKAEAISWKRIAKRDKEFSKYAKLVVDNALNGWQPGLETVDLDVKHLPLIAEMENHRNPGLNLFVFDNPTDCYNAIAKMKSDGRTGSFRILYQPFERVKYHHIALDVKLEPGKPISIIAFESALENFLYQIKNDLLSGVKNARVHVVPNIIQVSEWDCVMFSLNNALKSFKTHAEFAEKIHQRASKRDIPSLPPVFRKHIHSRSMAVENPDANQIVSKIKTGPAAETLRQRVEAFRTDRRGRHYSTSIEGFRLQEIKRVEDYLNQRAAASGMRRSVAWFS